MSIQQVHSDHDKQTGPKNKKTADIDFNKLIHIPPFVPNTKTKYIHKNSFTTTQPTVSLLTKICISPQDTTYAKVQSFIPHNFLHKDLVFESCIDNNATIFDAVFSFTCTCCTTDPVLTDEQTYSLNNSKCNNLFTFFICISNPSSHTLHFNKGMNIGHLIEIEDIKYKRTDQEDMDDVSIPPPSMEALVNLIQPTTKVIAKRKEEFNSNKIDLSHLSKDQASQLTQILQDNFIAFSSSMATLGHTDKQKPLINFTNDYPIKSLPFPVPYALQEEARKQLDQLIEANVIEKSVSSWACPMILVKKKSENNAPQQYRMALDLRLLNTIIEHSTYPLPKIQTLINNISAYKYFTTLDMPSAYYQIDLPEGYRNRICFTTQWGTFRFRRLPFGIKTAASSFQALIDDIIEETNKDGIYAYQDDTIICANSFEEMLSKIKIFLQLFSKYNLTLNLKKCNFHKTAVNFLGFHITNNRIYPITSNITKINSFPVPKTKRQIKKFLGLCGFYRTLIPAFAEVSEPLVALTSPHVPFQWTDTEEQAFQCLQQIFLSVHSFNSLISTKHST